jgi:EAL domain-containing protein (putative c-di-GMP-specific phosphodiesterase class I)
MVPALDPRSLRELTERVMTAVRLPFNADGVELVLTVTVGIATSEHSSDAFALVRDADTAVQAARAGGPGGLQVYDRTLRARQVERLRTETELRRAIERDELVMHYQPILDVERQRWSGVEALVRWQHPERGLLAPIEFIPLAEETGLIVPLGRRVLELVCEQARIWSQTLPDIHIAVNASAVQLGYPTTGTEIQMMVARSGLKPGALMLEVTESALMEELDTARTVLEQLSELGVRVLIDDFGTGYSSLARLGELPISGLKIDRQFVRGLGSDPTVMPVVRAIADLARAYGLEVVVEGIEDASALAGVDELGCEYAQGYHLGRPAPAAVIEGLLASPFATAR